MREHPSNEHCLQECSALGLLQAIISTGMVWLWDIGWTQMIERVVIVWALAWVAALLGALTASSRRELIARWQPL